MKSILLGKAFALIIACTLFSFLAFSQEQSSSSSEETLSQEESRNHDLLGNIKFRNLGPAAGGGRVAAVAGVPGQPNAYYVGAAAGGVFKTVDGGLSWKPIFEKQPVASIGAIALAPSNPSLVWVGTGEAKLRNDISTGKGVYFSPDAGASWKFMGLENAGQISSMVINPSNPEIVYVGALGHAWAPNPDRGVFRTTDGGKTWQKVLYVDEKTGVADLVMDPGSPMVLFAAMWQVQRYPWMLDNGGPSSAIYRSTDGGATWTKLTQGLPKGPLGRIGLAAAPSNPNHIYALIEAKKGRLWDSKDLGEHWNEVSDKHLLSARPFYFSRLFVAPDNESKLYFLSFDIVLSLDGGKTAHEISRGVHPDHHALWIDPHQPNRIIEGNDGGAYLSSDGGQTWRFLDNLPIEQFYQVATDDQMPYLLCGGLQDNNGWCGPSNSLSRGGIKNGDWWTAVGGDGEYIVPASGASHLIYADSQNGSIQRLDSQTGISTFIRPYLAGVQHMPPAELKYRFNWTSPIAASPSDPKLVYLGGSVLFKSTDAGNTWAPISPDLTRNDKTKQASSGGSIELDLSGAETYDTILSIAPSPLDSKVIWVGTDDGLVQVTRDGGQRWSNVTPNIPRLPEWGRIQQIEASPFSPETCYVAVDFHEVDNNRPYVFKTHDFGWTWTSISQGLPQSDPARVVRENPNRRGFLIVGTETGLFYSLNDGEQWIPLKGNFPTVPIYDIKFVKNTHDLVVASHGRGLFVLDAITPLEEMSAKVTDSKFHTFSVLPARLWHTWNKRGPGQSGFTAPNPPSGAVIDYYLKSDIEVTPEQKKKHQTPVKIVITDTDGQWVRTLYGPSKQALNRVTWDLKYQEPTKLTFVPVETPEPESEFFGTRLGAPVVPGAYKVAITFDGQTETQSVQVEADPRFPANMEAFRTQTRAALELRNEISALNEALNRLESLRSQLSMVQKLLATNEEQNQPVPASYTPVLQQARLLEQKVKTLEEKMYNTELQNSRDSIHFLQRISDRLQGLMRIVISPYDQAPSPLLVEEMTMLRRDLQNDLEAFNAFLKTDVAEFNKTALEHGANTLFAGNPIELKAGQVQSGGEN